MCVCGNWSDENKSDWLRDFQEKKAKQNKTKKTLDCEMMDVSSFFVLIPLIPVSDQDRFSSYYINTISSRQVMRIKKNINCEIIGWSSTKFSKPTSWGLYGKQ